MLPRRPKKRTERFGLTPSFRSNKIYAHAVSLAGALLFAGCVHSLIQSRSDVRLLDLLLFAVLVFIAEMVPTKIPNTDIDMTMTMPLSICLFLSHGLAAAVVFTSIPTFAASLLTQRNRPLKSLLSITSFNVANLILAVCIASLVFLSIGAKTNPGNKDFAIGILVLPLAIWIAVYSAASMLVLVMSIYKPEAWKVLLFNGLKWSVPNYLFSIPVSVLFASLLPYGPLGIFLLILPCLAGRQALNLSAQQINVYRDTITTLGSYMQHYHPYTKGHLERVADLADRIAREMKLPIQSLIFIRDAGILHDIGKVGVSEETLDKVGQLSDEDWATIRQHPVRGAEILAQMKYLDRIVPWVRGHHERPDGKGYPDGLKNEDIPVEAAVIAVADAFDAMTGGPDEKDQRVYRTPLTLDQAMDQVRYGAGTQFDVRIIKAFMRVMSEEGVGNGE